MPNLTLDARSNPSRLKGASRWALALAGVVVTSSARAQSTQIGTIMTPPTGGVSASSLVTQLQPQPIRVSDRWNSTATNVSTGSQGDPITLRWGFIADGVSIPGGVVSGEGTANSSLRSFLDTQFGSGPGGSDLTQRPWFSAFSRPFDRWSQVAGLTYVYEPNDDGATFVSSPGVTNVRPDLRIGGHPIDGQSGSNVLAYNYFPDSGDMVLDTQNTSFFTPTSDALGTRNVIAHEHGHGLGFDHVEPVNQTKLMEPFVSTAYDGPQFDDILAAQRNYGDPLEKGLGNNTALNATSLGNIALGGTVARGTSVPAGATNTKVLPTDIDFVSIDDDTDLDFYSFTLTATSAVTLTLAPRGPTYLEGPQDGVNNNETNFDASAVSDLTLQLLGTNGVTSLATANNTALGGTETITTGPLTAGTYFARISGSDGAKNSAQMYYFSVVVPEPASLASLAAGALVLASSRRRLRRK